MYILVVIAKHLGRTNSLSRHLPVITSVAHSGDFIHQTRRSTQRGQASLTKVDHYPYIKQCGKYALMTVGPW